MKKSIPLYRVIWINVKWIIKLSKDLEARDIDLGFDVQGRMQSERHLGLSGVNMAAARRMLSWSSGEASWRISANFPAGVAGVPGDECGPSAVDPSRSPG